MAGLNPALPQHPLLPISWVVAGQAVQLGWWAAAAGSSRSQLRPLLRRAVADLLDDVAVQPPPSAADGARASGRSPRRSPRAWLAWSYLDALPPPHQAHPCGVLLALAPQPVGVDIQALGLVPASERTALARDFLGRTDAAHDDAAFTQAWVNMEACDKALGQGLREASPDALRERALCHVVPLPTGLLRELGVPSGAEGTQGPRSHTVHAALALCRAGDLP